MNLPQPPFVTSCAGAGAIIRPRTTCVTWSAHSQCREGLGSAPQLAGGAWRDRLGRDKTRARSLPSRRSGWSAHDVKTTARASAGGYLHQHGRARCLATQRRASAQKKLIVLPRISGGHQRRGGARASSSSTPTRRASDACAALRTQGRAPSADEISSSTASQDLDDARPIRRLDFRGSRAPTPR